VPPEPAAIPMASASIAPFRDLFEPAEWEQFRRTMEAGAALLQKRRLWNISSTAHGGGVAEMLAWQIPYERDAGMDVRWVVIKGDPEFFAFTKRLHALLHGTSADGSEISAAERACFEQTAAANAAPLDRLIDAGDLVIVHDPQPAGLIPGLVRRGCHVIWRCHIGVDAPNRLSKVAWDFLRPWIGAAHVYVFSRRAYVWEGLDASRLEVIPPAIDPFAPKNAEMAPETVGAVLHATGIVEAGGEGEPAVRARDGSTLRVERRARLFPDTKLPVDEPFVLQVSRWDRLKDPVGVLKGFAMIGEALGAGHLVLAGPGASSVADDPEEKTVLREVEDAWRRLPAKAQSRSHLVRLPMDDQVENAVIVNALQRRAEVVVQKSLREGFGLTVAEAMWKSRPVVASRVGGIQDQIENGKNGVLIDDPQDLAGFGTALARLLANRSLAERLGAAAKRRVHKEFLAPRLLIQHVQLTRKLLRSAD
jgi:trehalose synthase